MAKESGRYPGCDTPHLHHPGHDAVGHRQRIPLRDLQRLGCPSKSPWNLELCQRPEVGSTPHSRNVVLPPRRSGLFTGVHSRRPMHPPRRQQHRLDQGLLGERRTHGPSGRNLAPCVDSPRHPRHREHLHRKADVPMRARGSCHEARRVSNCARNRADEPRAFTNRVQGLG